MSESGRKGPSIPAWQSARPSPASTQKETSTPTQPTSSTNVDPGEATTNTDGSGIAAKQEFEASKAHATDSSTDPDATLSPTPTPDETRTAPPAKVIQPTDPSRTDETETDGSDVAAKQEYDASVTVIDQVRKFLQDPVVKDASTAKKRTFLRSKGIAQEIVEQALGTAELDTSPAAATAATFTASEFNDSVRVRASVPQPPRPRDMPPIVTYPEFLVQPQKPPPLVTVDRLVNTAYITGGLFAAVYALSRYIVLPMSESLNEARHDFSAHTTAHLTTFNEKLGEVVSTLPAHHTLKQPDDATLDDDDVESVVSDPTELFHRDIGTQTSLPPSPLPELSSSFLSETPAQPEPIYAKQETRLRIIHSHISELLADSDTSGATNEELQKSVGDFKQELDRMVYSPPAYQYHVGDTVWTPPGTPRGEKKDDAVAEFRKEIRAVKGVLLSAKRFPSAAAAVR